MTKPIAKGAASPVSPGQHIDPECGSVAGEEDPGAALDLSAFSDARPAGSAAGTAPLNPGDEAPAGTPGTGENLCRECGGSGRLNGTACATCGGTGKVTTGVGGA